jgi:hypothetical protein
MLRTTWAAALAAVLVSVGLSQAITPTTQAAGDPLPFTLPTRLDLHDGVVQKFGDTYYAYGTLYGCGFRWAVKSPWCGFGVSTATSLDGPWSATRILVSRWQRDPYSGWRLNGLCSAKTGGKGCFNPRMLQRPDGVFVLWFNAVAARTSARKNAYFVMGCNGPAGPCGKEAGAPHGSTHKPRLHQCNGNNGDFTVVADGSDAVLFCSYGGVLAEERLDRSWANGAGVGATRLGGLTHVETPGVYRDDASGKWILTFSDRNCGYCAGTGTGYATAVNLVGRWTWPANKGWSAAANGRRLVDADSCGGQPRTVTTLDGVPYQGIDLWVGERNETNAGVRYEPLTFLNPANEPGKSRRSFRPFSCA